MFRYNGVARTLHWLIATLIILNLIGGLIHDEVKWIMPLHKSVGLTILVLSVLRLLWRFTYTKPPYPDTMSAFQRTSSAVVHGLLYVGMIMMPVTGWIMASAGKYPLTFFGLFNWPKLAVVKDSPLAEFGHEGHELGAWLMIALVLGHLGAALYHHYKVRDDILRRML